MPPGGEFILKIYFSRDGFVLKKMYRYYLCNSKIDFVRFFLWKRIKTKEKCSDYGKALSCTFASAWSHEMLQE